MGKPINNGPQPGQSCKPGQPCDKNQRRIQRQSEPLKYLKNNFSTYDINKDSRLSAEEIGKIPLNQITQGSEKFYRKLQDQKFNGLMNASLENKRSGKQEQANGYSRLDLSRINKAIKEGKSYKEIAQAGSNSYETYQKALAEKQKQAAEPSKPPANNPTQGDTTQGGTSEKSTTPPQGQQTQPPTIDTATPKAPEQAPKLTLPDPSAQIPATPNKRNWQADLFDHIRNQENFNKYDNNRDGILSLNELNKARESEWFKQQDAETNKNIGDYDWNKRYNELMFANIDPGSPAWHGLSKYDVNSIYDRIGRNNESLDQIGDSLRNQIIRDRELKDNLGFGTHVSDYQRQTGRDLPANKFEQFIPPPRRELQPDEIYNWIPVGPSSKLPPGSQHPTVDTNSQPKPPWSIGPTEPSNRPDVIPVPMPSWEHAPQENLPHPGPPRAEINPPLKAADQPKVVKNIPPKSDTERTFERNFWLGSQLSRVALPHPFNMLPLTLYGMDQGLDALFGHQLSE